MARPGRDGAVFVWRDGADSIAVLPAPDHPGTLALLVTDRDGDVVSLDVPKAVMAALGEALRGG